MLDNVEACIVHLDITSLDMNQVRLFVCLFICLFIYFTGSSPISFYK